MSWFEWNVHHLVAIGIGSLSASPTASSTYLQSWERSINRRHVCTNRERERDLSIAGMCIQRQSIKHVRQSQTAASPAKSLIFSMKPIILSTEFIIFSMKFMIFSIKSQITVMCGSRFFCSQPGGGAGFAAEFINLNTKFLVLNTQFLVFECRIHSWSWLTQRPQRHQPAGLSISHSMAAVFSQNPSKCTCFLVKKWIKSGH